MFQLEEIMKKLKSVKNKSLKIEFMSRPNINL